MFSSKSKPKKFLIVSSSCIYSDNGPNIISEDENFNGVPETANSGYGWAKRFMEQKI